MSSSPIPCTPFLTKARHLAVYVLLSLLLTISNKAFLIRFPYPWLLTAMHAGSTTVGARMLLAHGAYQLTEMSRGDSFVLFALSLLYTVNVAISNVSL